MVEKKIESVSELLKTYKYVTGRKPKKDDLVYVPSQKAIFKVKHVDRMYVTVERSHEGSGLLLKLPPSHYKIIEKK